jgi:uncharacterized protein YkwD
VAAWRCRRPAEAVEFRIVLDRRAGRWPSALALSVLVLACLAPLPVAIAAGLAGDLGEDRTETAGGEGARRSNGDGLILVGGVPLGGVTTPVDGAGADDPASGDAAGAPMTGPRASSTTNPTAEAPSAPPAEDPAPTPPTTAAPPPDTPVPTAGPPPTRVTAVSLAEQVVALANADRASLAGCDPLVIDQRLVTVAQAHSDDMAANDYFSHTSLDGTTFGQRLSAAGYSGGGENIAQGQQSPAEVHEAWMGSDGHRENILNCGFSTVGVGVETSTWTWTQDFGV